MLERVIGDVKKWEGGGKLEGKAKDLKRYRNNILGFRSERRALITIRNECRHSHKERR